MAARRVSSGTDKYINYAAYDRSRTGRDISLGGARRTDGRAVSLGGANRTDGIGISLGGAEHTAGREYQNATQRKRARARSLSRGYVLFLSIACGAALLMCVQFLRLKSEYTTVTDQNEVMVSRLTKLRAENDALYEDADNEISLREIKDAAINRFGMNYATQQQIIWYNAEDSGYIRQYGDIPD